MLAKLTRGNQVTIPREIVRQAGLKDGNDLLDVRYADGIIEIVPVAIEERLPADAFERFQKRTLTIEDGDVAVSATDAETFLSRRKGRRKK